MNLDEADKLARETDYADAATHQDDNPINWGDAAAFFLEGYEHSRKLNQWTTGMKVAFTQYQYEKEHAEITHLSQADKFRSREALRGYAVNFIEAAITARDLDKER